MEIREKVWVIMDKKREVIAKGVPRNRYLIRLDDKEDKKRIITYSSKGMAEAGFKYSWFYGGYNYKKEDMEAVEAELVIKPM